MTNEIIRTELESIKKTVLDLKKEKISDEKAFEYLSVYAFYYSEFDFRSKFFDIDSEITNGANDGGIDFIYYDEDNYKVILGQCKYSKNFKLNDVISELNKMSSTYENFRNHNTGQYNNKIKRELQNALDRLPEGNEGNIEYTIFSIASIDSGSLARKIDNEHNVYSKEMVTVYGVDDIEKKLKEMVEQTSTVSEFKIKIDHSNNYLEYETDKIQGIMVNMSSKSLIEMYNQHWDNGLFDMNIRKYVRNKIVDEGIEKTLDDERENFWVYNNGLIIACESFDIDGYIIKLRKFSIVNGGQTTNRIGNYKGKNTEEFYIPCKIISVQEGNNHLFGKIAEATNSQKPIYPRDLKANSPEMKRLQSWLNKEGVYLEIKRGEDSKKFKHKIKIKNDEFGQLILSFVLQQPGTSRSNKKAIFDNNINYNRIYKQNYERDANKKKFILDLIKLNNDYKKIDVELKESTNVLTPSQKNILKNAKNVIMSLFGISYMIANGDIDKASILQDPDIIYSTDFEYGSFISNYKQDDYEDLLKEFVTMIVESLEDIYEKEANANRVTSVSNLFKSDKKYKDKIIINFLQTMNRSTFRKSYEKFLSMLKREIL